MTALNKHENYEESNKNKKGEVVGKIDKFVGEWERLTDEQIQDEKTKFVEKYFETKFVDYGDKPRYGMSFGMELVATSVPSQRYIDSLWNQYSFRFDYDKEVFMSEVAAAVTFSVFIFNESQDTYDYSKMNDRGKWDKDLEADKNGNKYAVLPSSEHMRLHAYLVKRGKKGISPIESYLMSYANEAENKRMTGSGDIEMMDVSSFDAKIEIDGELMQQSELIGEEDNIFSDEVGNVYDSDEGGLVYYSPYVKNHFVKWFDEWIEKQHELRANKDKNVRATADLTSHQLIYYSKMKEVYIGELLRNDDKDEKDKWKKAYNKYSPQSRNDYNNRIKNAALEAYKREFPDGSPSIRSMENEKNLKLLQEAIDIVYCDKLTAKQRNYRLSRWLCGRTHEPIIDRIINDKLDFNDSEVIFSAKASRSQKVDAQTLYRFMQVVEDTVNDLQVVKDIQSNHTFDKNGKIKIHFEKFDHEFIEGSRERAITTKKARDERYKQLKQSDVKVFKNGELVDVIKYEDQPKRKEYKVKKMQSNGKWTEVDLNSDDNF